MKRYIGKYNIYRKEGNKLAVRIPAEVRDTLELRTLQVLHCYISGDDIIFTKKLHGPEYTMEVMTDEIRS